MSNQKIISRPDHSSPIGTLNGESIFISEEYQNYFDELQQKLNDNLLGNYVIVPVYTVATAPSTAQVGGVISVSDEVGGRTLAQWDGTNWRRVSDGSIITT